MPNRPLLRTLLLAGLALAGAALPGGARADDDYGPPTTACPRGVLTLRLLKPQANPVYPAQVSAFEAANPCTKLDVSEVPFGQLADKINVLAASGTPPDVVVYDGPNTQSYAAAGMLLPLDPYLPAGLREDILPATLTEHTWDGKLYSPGLQQTTLALFYNADMLEKAGIPTPPRSLQDAWTWPQAMEAFRKCQQGRGDDVSVWGLAPSRFGTGTPGFVYRDLLFLRTQGDPEAPKDSSAYRTYWAISPDGKTAQGWLNTPEAVEGARFFQGMFGGGGAEAVTPKAGIPNAFQDRKACFTIDTSYFIAGLRNSDPGFRWGVTPMPRARAPVVHTGSLTLGVMARSRHHEEAVRFVMQVSTGRIAEEFARSYRIIPVLKSVAAGMPELGEYPLSIFAEELRAWGHPRPPSPRFAQYDKVVTDALRDIAYGADPKTRLDAAVRALTPILSR